MGRDYSNYERNERRNFGGRDNWDADLEEGYDPGAGERIARRSGWQGTAVTGYRDAPEDEWRRSADRDWDDDDDDRDLGGGPRRRRQRVSWGREQDDERRYASRGYELDRDVFRSGDRDEWRGEFGPKEDRTRWGRGNRDWDRGERDWDRDRGDWGSMRGTVREGRQWTTSGRDRYSDWRESGNDPYQERFRNERRRMDAPSYSYPRNADWTRDTDYGRRTDYPRSEAWGERRMRGTFTGRGPRGYQRSDERIREDVNEILWHHSDIDASEIDVIVQGGEVTLEGTVDDRWTKRLAEDAVWEARGVQDVHNRLRIRREQMTQQMTQRGQTYRRDTQASVAGDPSTARPGAVRLEGGRMGAGAQLRTDMTVVGSNGDEVGVIKEIRDNDILVDRPMARDVYVPISAITVSDGSTARLNIDTSEIDNQGWENPPLTGTDTDYDERVELT